MKIRPLTDALQSLHRVAEKQDKDGFADRSRDDKQQDRQDKEEERFVRTTAHEVATAIDTFTADRQARESGLSASFEGTGPGLRVLLKDGSGAVIRQMTGEEFVKLRETVAKDVKAPGKLLDQKL